MANIAKMNEAAKWIAIKEKFTKGLSTKQARNVSIMMESTRQALNEAVASGATSASNIASINRQVLPLIRRVMPTVIANEIMGVVPMSGPVAQITTMRVQYAETVPSNGTGVIAGTEALSPDAMARYYSGNQDIENPDAAETADLEFRMGSKIKIQFPKETVTAKSHRLSAEWSIEAKQDAQSQYDIDLEAEIFAGVAQEMTVEIDQLMLYKLRRLAGVPAVVFDQAAGSGVGISVADRHANFATLVSQQAALIGKRTRRDRANWGVGNYNIVPMLESAKASGFAATTAGNFEAPTNTKYVGTLNGYLKTYIDTYAADDEPFLIGYKGTKEADDPAFYCPYVPMMTYGAVINYETGAFVTSFLTRYGYIELSNSNTSLGNAQDYVSKIGLKNVKFF